MLNFSAETVASSGYVAFSLGAWVVGTAACFSSSLPSQGQTFAAYVGSRLVAWNSDACATTVAINDMVCISALSVCVARDARRRDGLGTNEYLCSPLELTELILSTATKLFATCERH